MLVEIFEGVFVRADQVHAILAREEKDRITGARNAIVRVWFDSKQDQISRAKTFNTLDGAQQAAREIKEQVNMALERGRG